jgi:hypothetical protein
MNPKPFASLNHFTVPVCFTVGSLSSCVPKILVGTKPARQSGDLDRRLSCSPYRGRRGVVAHGHLPGGRGAFHGLHSAGVAQHQASFARETNSIE